MSLDNEADYAYAMFERVDAQLAHMLTRAERDAEAFRAQEAVIAGLVDAAVDFCEKVDKGWARSVNSYHFFKSAIKLARKPDADVLKVTP